MQTKTESEAQVLRRINELQANVSVESNGRWLFERYYRRVLLFFRLRRFSNHEAEDLTQDVFLQVFKGIGSFQGQSSFDAWLFAVAANRCRYERRRRGSSKRGAPEVPLDAANEPTIPGLEIEDRQALPDRVVFEKQRREELDRAVGQLPPQMKQCLHLRLDQGLKYREIAVLLKISVETVKAHFFQARRRLRAELSAELGEWDD